jgi:hypothetical protein
MRVRAVFVLLALTALLGACGGSAPEASKTAIAQPSAATEPASTAPAATAAEAPLAGPTTAPSMEPGGAPPATRTAGVATSHTAITGPPSSAPATSVPPTTRPVADASTPKAPKRTTAATWAPSSPQSSPSQSGWALLDAWVANNRAMALQDASPAAVSALFAHVYPGAGVQYRGCSSPPGNTASNCVYRDGNDLLSLTVSRFPRGWAVTGAVLES